MARLASVSKGGYFATPPAEMELLLRALQVQEGAGAAPFFIYDPCVGEGEALSMIASEMRNQGANVKTYGTEIEEGRAEAATEVLDVVLHEGYQSIRSEPKFSLLWLNAPYQEGFSERTELTFLRALTSAKHGVLMKGGLLLFCVPQYVLKDTAGVLSGRLQEIAVYRFTDAHYDVFKQVVVIGRLGKGPTTEQKRYYKALVAIGEGTPEMLPTLDEVQPFTVYPCESEDEPMFRAGIMDPAELARDMSVSSLLGEIEKRLIPKSGAVTMKRPMLPLKPAHMGTALAAGAVGGNLGTHIITGVTKQRTDIESIIDEETGKSKGERITKHFTSVVRAFTPDGVVDLK